MNKYFFDEQTADGMRPIVKDEKHTRTYELQKILGTGASCVVYVAKESGRSCLIKEFNPKYGNITRNDNGELICEDERTKLLFDDGLRRFKEACEKQNDFRNNSELKNYISPAVSGFEGNNTYYSEIVDFNGTDYSQYTDKTLKELLERVRALTKVIGIYHKDGYLHLDIKPENIFVLEEAEKLPILIDFDSITTKKEIELTRVSSYSEEWAAAEQKDINSFVRKVCPATDLFAIGEILFYKLFNRHSTRFERRSFSNFEFNSEEGLLKNIDHKIFPLLKEIFNHTICTCIGSRYQAAEELIEKLDKAIELADPKRAFLPACNLNTKDFFIGRDNELAEIEQKLKECDEIYVSGFGGIGKSELVRQYAKLHKSEFDSIICVTFNSDLESMLANIKIANFDVVEKEPIRDKLQRIINKLQEFKKNGEKILFIVDNFDTEPKDEECRLFDEFISCTKKTIVTTRNTDIDGKTVISIGAIENLRAIFDHHYGRQLSLEEDKAVNEILDIFQGHTLATELLAKQMKASRIVPSLMLERLESKGLREIGNEKVKYGNKKNNAYNFIKEIFDVSELTDDEIYVLVNLSLIPPSGICADDFIKLCELADRNQINELNEWGWINQNNDTDFVSVHPLIVEVLLEELENHLDECDMFLDNFTNDTQFNCSEYDLAIMCCDMCRKINSFGSINVRCAEFIIYTARNAKGMGIEEKYIKFLNRVRSEKDVLRKLDVNLHIKLHKSLGWMYFEISDYSKAVLAFEKALEYSMSNAYESNNHLDTFNELINSCIENRSFTKAKKYIKQCRKACKRECKEHPIEYANLCENEAQILIEYNKYKEAEILYLRALEIKTKHKDEENNDLSAIYNNLGNFYNDMEQYGKAENYYRLSLGEEMKRGKRPGNRITCHHNLADVLQAQGKFIEAKDLLDGSLKMAEEFYGRCHPQIAGCHEFLGHFYAETYNFKCAIQEYTKSLDILVKFFDGEISLDIATKHFSLGVCYENLKDYKMAYREYRTLTEITEALESDLTKDAYKHLNRVRKKLNM